MTPRIKRERRGNLADIFISYRREGGTDMAQLVYHRLISDGYDVFLDVDKLRSGIFKDKLYQEIENSTDFLLILSPNALDRCKISGDWVCLEIEHAIKCGKNIVPILMSNFEFPTDIPINIQTIQDYSGLEAPPPRYYDALFEKLKNVYLLSSPSSRNSSQNNSNNTPITAVTTAAVRKAKNENFLLFTAVTCIIIMLLVSFTIMYSGIQSRRIDKEFEYSLELAQQHFENKEYQSAQDILNSINQDWDRYKEVSILYLNIQREMLLQQYTECITSEDYKRFIKNVQEITPDLKDDAEISLLYTTAIDEYEKLLMLEIKELIQQGNYSAARTSINYAQELIGSTSSLEIKLSEIEAMEIAQNVQAFEDLGNYAEAIKYLIANIEIVSEHAFLASELEKYTNIYRQSVFAEAAKSFEENGSSAAISVLNAAFSVLPDDPLIQETKQSYENALPVDIITLNATKQGQYIHVGNFYGCPDNDVSGNQYSTSSVHWMYELSHTMDSTEKDRSITYFLNQEYDFITGVLYRPYSTLTCEFEWANPGGVVIYGDGTVLYEEKITQDTWEPISFKVNVTGVRELTLQLNGFWSKNATESAFGYEWNSKCCLAELQVSKQPKIE